MPNDLINALLGQEMEVPRGPSLFGAEPPRPEDAISNLYRANAPKSTWLHDLAMKMTPGPQTGSMARDLAGGLSLASLALRPSGVSYANTPRPTLRTQGKIRSMDRPLPRHPAENMYPNIVAAQAAANFPWPGADEFKGYTSPSSQTAAAQPPEHSQTNYNDVVDERFGGMAPPTKEMPLPESLALQSGRFMPQSGSFAAPSASVPLPRPSPFGKDFINPILLTKPYPRKRKDALAPIPEYMKYQDAGLMHMQEGGYNPGQPMIVGEDGPEVVVPGGPSSVIPNSLAVQSGMINAPSASFPETGRERRSRKSREFDSSLKDFISSPSNLLPLAGGPAFIPAALAMEGSPNEGPLKKQEPLPVGGTKIKTDQTVAGFPEPRPALSREDQAKLNVLNTEIEKHRATLAKYEALKKDDPARHARLTANAQAALQTLVPQQAAIDMPHRKNMEDWQGRLNNHMVRQNEALFQQQQKEAAANERFQIRNPGWGDAAPKYGAGLAGTMGALAGLTGKGKILKPMAQGFGLGALEGFGAASFPNLADAGALPYGSQSQQDAAWQMLDPAFLGTKVLPEMGLHGIAGALGASTAAAVPHLIKSGAASIKSIAKWLKNPTGAKAPSVPRAKAVPVPPPPVVTQPPPMATQPPPILPGVTTPVQPVKRTRKKKTP